MDTTKALCGLMSLGIAGPCRVSHVSSCINVCAMGGKVPRVTQSLSQSAAEGSDDQTLDRAQLAI